MSRNWHSASWTILRLIPANKENYEIFKLSTKWVNRADCRFFWRPESTNGDIKNNRNNTLYVKISPYPRWQELLILDLYWPDLLILDLEMTNFVDSGQGPNQHSGRWHRMRRLKIWSFPFCHSISTKWVTESTKWVTTSTKWVTESTSAEPTSTSGVIPNRQRGSRQLYRKLG